MRRHLIVLLAFSLATAAAAPAKAASVVVKQIGDAAISHDSAAQTWSIAAGGTTLTLGLDPARDFTVQKLATLSNKLWIVGAVPDTAITLNGAR
jgi:hypothetical protein